LLAWLLMGLLQWLVTGWPGGPREWTTVTVTVRPGTTWSSLAGMYAPGVDRSRFYRRMRKLNPGVDSAKLQPGTELTVPDYVWVPAGKRREPLDEARRAACSTR
jgi:LysM domain